MMDSLTRVPSLAVPIVVACVGWLSIQSAAGQTEVDVTYGQAGNSSVAGTSVLVGWLRQRGHSVFSWNRLSPRLETADTIVWWPDEYNPPTDEQLAWLKAWLDEDPARTLVYIGRDFDAVSPYFKQVVPQAPPKVARELERRGAEAEIASREFRASYLPQSADTEWFQQMAEPTEQVERLGGRWSRGIDPSKVEMTVGTVYATDGRLFDAYPYDVVNLLTANGRNVVTRITFDNAYPPDQVILVANGSFLTNAQLVNNEHRRLARRLIEAIEEFAGASQTIAFLETGVGGPSIFATEPTGDLFEQLRPVLPIILQLAFLGIVLCFVYAPIFGRPKEALPPPAADFDQHLQALGALLRRSGNAAYAQQQVDDYHQRTGRERGEPAPPGA